MKLAKGINVLWALPMGRGEAAAETELKYERTERHSSGNHFHFTNYPSLQKTDWRETLGLNLVAHPFPAAHWYHFFDQIENHRSFSMQTPWRMLPCTRNCWNLCSWLREWAAPQSLETKVKGAAFTPGTEQPGLVFHTSATSKCHSVATWQGCVSTGICYLSFQGWAGHFLTDNPTGPDKWLNKLGLGGIFFLFSVPTLKAWLQSQWSKDLVPAVLIRTTHPHRWSLQAWSWIGRQIPLQRQWLCLHWCLQHVPAGGTGSVWKEPLPRSGPRMVYGDGRMDVVKILIRMTCVVDIWQRTTIWIQKQTWVFKLLLAKAKNIAEVLGQTGWEGFCQQSLLTQYCFH